MVMSSLIFFMILTYIIATCFVAFRMISNTKKNKSNKAESIPHEIERDMAFYNSVSEESQFRYYEYVRAEIKREDDITNQRLTWTIAFHSFLVNSFAMLLVFGWDGKTPSDIVNTRGMAVIVIGVIGITFAFTSFMGIIASHRSISDTKIRWDSLNKVWKLYPSKVPQTFGQNKAFTWGRTYALVIPSALFILWSILTIGYLIIRFTGRS